MMMFFHAVVRRRDAASMQGLEGREHVQRAPDADVVGTPPSTRWRWGRFVRSV